MKRRLVFYTFLLALFFAPIRAAQAQAQVSGTAHGVQVSWTAAAPGSNPIAGYFVFRCSGTSSTCPNTSPVGWTQENTAAISALAYLDPASNGFTNGASYTYVVQTVDTVGNVSAFSNSTTVAIPSVGFPGNPTAPTAPTAKVQ